jgi:hypothetical protein
MTKGLFSSSAEPADDYRDCSTRPSDCVIEPSCADYLLAPAITCRLRAFA